MIKCQSCAHFKGAGPLNAANQYSRGFCTFNPEWKELYHPENHFCGQYLSDWGAFTPARIARQMDMISVTGEDFRNARERALKAEKALKVARAQIRSMK